MPNLTQISDAANGLRPSQGSEGELLVHCARGSIEPERAERIRELVALNLNWDTVVKLAHRNGLLALLHFHLNQVCAANVPAGPKEFLRDYFQKNSAFNVLFTAELLRLLRAFAENGISAVPYKGPALAAKTYGNLALRQFCDLDILVRESDVWKASELIMAHGFEPHFFIPPDKRDAFIRLSYVQLFRRDAGRTLIELHWSIAPRFFAVRFDAESFWRRLEPLELQGATVLIPGAEDMLLMLCVHGAKDCWEKLEWVSSLAELIRSKTEFDWQSVWRQAGEMHCRRALGLGLLLAHGLFDVPVPQQFGSMMLRYGKLGPRASRPPIVLLNAAKEVARDFFSDEVGPRSFSRRLSFHLRLKDNIADKARHCARLALTTTPVDWSTAPLPGSLSFAYPLFRAIRLTRKYGLNRQARS